MRLLLLGLGIGHTVSNLPEHALLIKCGRNDDPEQDIQTGIDVVCTRFALHSRVSPIAAEWAWSRRVNTGLLGVLQPC